MLGQYNYGMASRRSYGDPCGIARALDLVGERWALLVVRELVFGPKRFTDLRAGLPHLGPDVLAQRLRDLEQAGIVQRRTLPPPAGSRVYELTDGGTSSSPSSSRSAAGAAARRSPRGRGARYRRANPRARDAVRTRRPRMAWTPVTSFVSASRASPRA